MYYYTHVLPRKVYNFIKGWLEVEKTRLSIHEGGKK